MLSLPRLCGVAAAFLYLLGAAVDVARAVDVDPAVLDACPGYNATNVKVGGPRLSAKLVLFGKPCNVFGDDIEFLNLAVVYETGTLAVWHLASQRIRIQRLMFAFRPRHRHAHSSQDHRRIQRTIRSS